MARRAQAIVRYDGPILSTHEMDVHDLAPSLMALGDLCKYANEIFNGESASVRVLVRADIEHKCFQIQLDLVQTLYEQLTAILDKDSIKDAKNILEWLGILGGGAGFVGVGLMGLYKALYGKTSKDEQIIEARSEGGSIVYQVTGDGNEIRVSHEVHQLAQDPRMLPTFKKVLRPLEKDGYEKLEFESDGQITQYFSRDQARALVQAPEDAIITRDGHTQVSSIRTAVRLRKPVYEGPSKWGVMYKRAIEAKMADQQWLEDFQAGRVQHGPRYNLIVDLEERVPVDGDGAQIGEPVYTILKVHGVEPPPEQMRLFRPETPPRA